MFPTPKLKSIWVENTVAASKANVEWTVDLQHSLAPHVSGAYVNYIDPNQPNWTTAYYGNNYERLVAVKRAVDPTNFFRFEQSIDAAADGGSAPAPAPMVACEASKLVTQMYAFQAGQNAMDASGLALLYTPKGSNFIPASVPEPTAAGRAAIEASFAQYFATLDSINETVVGPMIVSGNMGSFAKTIDTVPKSTKTLTVTHVDNWFAFDCATDPPLIATFHAMFNTSSTASV